jgi:hypothetical protein
VQHPLGQGVPEVMGPSISSVKDPLFWECPNPQVLCYVFLYTQEGPQTALF